MKKACITLFACALAAPIIANATPSDPFMVMENDAGGRIELYDVKSPTNDECKGEFIAKAWGRGIADKYGCWSASSDTVSISWTVNGTQSTVYKTYLVKDFNLTSYGNRLMAGYKAKGM